MLSGTFKSLGWKLLCAEEPRYSLDNFGKKNKNRCGVWWHDESLQVHIEFKGRKVLKHFTLNGTVIIIMRQALGPAFIVTISCCRLGKKTLSQNNQN